jgi:hypothetical protein
MVRVVAERDDAQKTPTGLTAIRVFFAPAWRTTSQLRCAELRSIKIECYEISAHSKQT